MQIQFSWISTELLPLCSNYDLENDIIFLILAKNVPRNDIILI